MNHEQISECLLTIASAIRTNKELVTPELLTFAEGLLQYFKTQVSKPDFIQGLKNSEAIKSSGLNWTDFEYQANLYNTIKIFEKIIEFEKALIKEGKSEQLAELMQRLAARKVLLRAVAWFI